MPHERAQFYISGAEIRSVRKHWAFSRQDLAAEFGVSPSTIIAWERDGVSARNQRFDRHLFGVLRTSRDLLAIFRRCREMPESLGGARVIVFGFYCDAAGCDQSQQFSLAELCHDTPPLRGTFFDKALYANRAHGWRVEGNERELPDWDCKVFCPDHIHLHRDASL